MFSMPDRRGTTRSSTLVDAIVKVKETEKEFWQETAEIADISKNSATLFLNRKCQIGRLISLLLPLEKEFRLYDHDKELYRVWGIIQHCTHINNYDDSRYHIGIAFIGKFAPESYKNNPEQSYRIVGTTEKGLWNIVEAQRDFIHRKYPRYWISMEVSLILTKTDDDVIEDNNALTENISQKGAAVSTTLSPEVGDNIEFYCKEFDFSTVAVVHHLRKMVDNVNNLHLEFPHANFPIDKITLPFYDGEEDERENNDED